MMLKLITDVVSIKKNFFFRTLTISFEVSEGVMLMQ
jgi:hypothetical protein